MDARIKNINSKEEKRQRETISLIASENYASSNVREAMASVFTNKYSEGYPGKRYYPGNKNADELENLCRERALSLFKLNENKWHVNVQPYSGSPANFAVYAALLKNKDKALGMSLQSGGHLTHGHKVSHTGKFFNFIQYGLTEKGLIDYEEVEKLAKKHKPKLIVTGISAYSRKLNFKKLKDIASKHNSLLMADVAHIAGLIAGGAHPSPFPWCDVVTTTTHKTLRGPRAALIFSKKDFAAEIDKSVFPGLQGGPHNNTTAGIAVALKEAQTKKFQGYATQIVKNSKELARELQNKGYDIVSNGTDNHMFLVDLTNKNITGKEAEELLEKSGITANRNAVPGDPRSPLDPSGLRVGTPGVTTRGMKEKEMRKIASLIDMAVSGKNVGKEVKNLALKFSPPL